MTINWRWKITLREGERLNNLEALRLDKFNDLQATIYEGGAADNMGRAYHITHETTEGRTSILSSLAELVNCIHIDPSQIFEVELVLDVDLAAGKKRQRGLISRADSSTLVLNAKAVSPELIAEFDKMANQAREMLERPDPEPE